MTLVKLIDLVGQDVAGKLADVSSHKPDGRPCYQKATMIRRLKRVYLKREKNHRGWGKWLRWEWEAEPKPDGYIDCGYSGVRIWSEEDGENEFNANLCILIED